jgi:hypothetical protein
MTPARQRPAAGAQIAGSGILLCLAAGTRQGCTWQGRRRVRISPMRALDSSGPVASLALRARARWLRGSHLACRVRQGRRTVQTIKQPRNSVCATRGEIRSGFRPRGLSTRRQAKHVRVALINRDKLTRRALRLCGARGEFGNTAATLLRKAGEAALPKMVCRAPLTNPHRSLLVLLTILRAVCSATARACRLYSAWLAWHRLRRSRPPQSPVPSSSFLAAYQRPQWALNAPVGASCAAAAFHGSHVINIQPSPTAYPNNHASRNHRAHQAQRGSNCGIDCMAQRQVPNITHCGF